MWPVFILADALLCFQCGWGNEHVYNSKYADAHTCDARKILSDQVWFLTHDFVRYCKRWIGVYNAHFRFIRSLLLLERGCVVQLVKPLEGDLWCGGVNNAGPPGSSDPLLCISRTSFWCVHTVLCLILIVAHSNYWFPVLLSCSQTHVTYEVRSASSSASQPHRV